MLCHVCCVGFAHGRASAYHSPNLYTNTACQKRKKYAMVQNTDGENAGARLWMDHVWCVVGLCVSGKGYGATGGIHHRNESEEIERGDFLLLGEV